MGSRPVPASEVEAIEAELAAQAAGALRELPGGFVVVPTVVAHQCALPDIMVADYVPGEHKVPQVRMVYPEGSRYYCTGCGAVYVCTWVKAVVARGWYTAGRWAWLREARRQRRRRLGLRWWQRG